MPNGISWQQIKADFGDANDSMKTGIGAISQAGTVFGELRKSILDQEQRAIDNAYRDKKFNEDVRQFGLNYALNKDKFGEDVRHNKTSEDLTRESHQLQRRGQDLNYKAHMASVDAANGMRQLQAEHLKNTLAKEQESKDWDTLYGLHDSAMSSDSNISVAAKTKLSEIMNDSNLPPAYRNAAAKALDSANSGVIPTNATDRWYYSLLGKGNMGGPKGMAYQEAVAKIDQSQFDRANKIKTEAWQTHKKSAESANTHMDTLNLDKDAKTEFNSGFDAANEVLQNYGFYLDKRGTLDLVGGIYETTGNIFNRKTAFDKTGPFDANPNVLTNPDLRISFIAQLRTGALTQGKPVPSNVIDEILKNPKVIRQIEEEVKSQRGQSFFGASKSPDYLDYLDRVGLTDY